MGDDIKRAARIVEERVSAYVKPDLDPAVESDLLAYVRNSSGAELKPAA